MLRRKIYQQLVDWKDRKQNECLMLKGARQIGKTFIVREFGKNEYDFFIEINFLKKPELKEIFNGSLAADEIYKRLTAYLPENRIVPGRTLIFLDEIQQCPKARTSLKFLAEDNRCDVIASGSLLGLHYGQDADPTVGTVDSVPVGYERQMMMYSLDFTEFLWGYGYQDDTLAYLKEYYDKREPLPTGLNEQFHNMLREYIVVGGMPEVVQTFFDTKHYGEVQRVQDKILASYDDDISNHVKTTEKAKVRACYDSLPRQLARENKKFKYSEVEKKATARKFEDSITWLRDANLVNVCYNVSEPLLPLVANSKTEEFKVYTNDTGLLLARYGYQTKLAVLQKTLLGNAKGGIYENLIAEMLVKRGYRINYYRMANGSLELEFLIEKDGGVVPIEVKAGNTATVSLNRFIETYHPPIAYKFIDGNIGFSDSKLTLPHYMAMFV